MFKAAGSKKGLQMKSALSLSVGVLVLMVSCGREDQDDVVRPAPLAPARRSSAESSSTREPTMLRPTSFKYGYDGQFGRFDMADTAEALNGDRIVGKAKALELMDAPGGGPKMMKIEVSHYSSEGQPVYRGFVYIQAGFGGGKLIKEERVSGRKKFTVFGSWQFGH